MKKNRTFLLLRYIEYRSYLKNSLFYCRVESINFYYKYNYIKTKNGYFDNNMEELGSTGEKNYFCTVFGNC